jgi:hypothetical protein
LQDRFAFAPRSGNWPSSAADTDYEIKLRPAASWSGWPDLNRRPLRPEAKFIDRHTGPMCWLACRDCPWVSVGVRAQTRRLSLS